MYDCETNQRDQIKMVGIVMSEAEGLSFGFNGLRNPFSSTYNWSQFLYRLMEPSDEDNKLSGL